MSALPARLVGFPCHTIWRRPAAAPTRHRSAAAEFGIGAAKAAAWGLVYAVAISISYSVAAAHYGRVPMTTAPATVQITQQDIDRAFAAKVVTFNRAHGCASVADWKRAHPGRVPARMVQHADQSDQLRIVRWTYPAAPGEWVDGFCGTA